MRGTLFKAGALRGDITVPGDKSISHRAFMLGAAAPGTTFIAAPNRGADVLATRDAVAALGAQVEENDAGFVVGGGTLRTPGATIDARNSGTTARLLLGLCAGHGIAARFDGDASLRRRPMERVARPLRDLGAQVTTTEGCLPATVQGIERPKGGTFALELPSAQLKSAILLANLNARGTVRITGDARSRDHTERMLRRFGREIDFDGEEIVLKPGALRPAEIHVPGDLSAAAFFLVAAAVTPGSDLVVRGAGINPTRTGILDALAAMGARIVLKNRREIDAEPVADIHSRYARLRAIDVRGDLVVRTIDEIPLLAVAAAFAHGVTRIREAAELRSKESDRIASIAQTLRACGVEVTEFPDGIDVRGGAVHAPRAAARSFGDHRIAMAIAVLAAGAGPIELDDTGCIDISFPGFATLWERAQRGAGVA